MVTGGFVGITPARAVLPGSRAEKGRFITNSARFGWANDFSARASKCTPLANVHFSNSLSELCNFSACLHLRFCLVYRCRFHSQFTHPARLSPKSNGKGRSAVLLVTCRRVGFASRSPFNPYLALRLTSLPLKLFALANSHFSSLWCDECCSHSAAPVHLQLCLTRLCESSRMLPTPHVPIVAQMQW